MIINMKLSLIVSIMLGACLGQSLIEHGYHAHSDMTKGSCPKLNDTIGTRKESFDPHKLLGLWKTIYMSKDRTEGMDCLTLKFENFTDGNSSQVRVLTGHQLVDPVNDASRFEDFEMDGVFYDEAFLTFGDPDNKARAAIQEKVDLIRLSAEEMMKRDMKPLTKEKKK